MSDVNEVSVVKHGTYEKNTRYPSVPKGTEFVIVKQPINLGRFGDASGVVINRISSAINEAWDEAFHRFGKFPHDCVEISVTVLTLEVVVEFRLNQELKS